MIVREQPTPFSLFLVIQGSIVPRIYHKILAVIVLSSIIYLFDTLAYPLPHVPISAMGVFGLALSLFLGFRNNAAYERWWEARKLWGQLIAEVRSLGRQLEIFQCEKALREDIMNMAVAFAHLHREGLRGDKVEQEVALWIGKERAADLFVHINPADSALCDLASKINSSSLDSFARMTLSQTLANMGAAQASCERIATTPLPFVYSLLVRRTTYLYCFILPFALAGAAGLFTPILSGIVAYMFFGLQAVTRELEHPFADTANGLPLTALCRIVEISAAQSLGKQALPLLEPKNFILN